MRTNKWIISGLAVIALLSLSLFFVFPQEEPAPDQRQFIRAAVGNYGSLKDKGIGQVEILSDREVRFLITGGSDDTALSQEALDNNLESFCTLLLQETSKSPVKIDPDTEFELSYHHRQITAISGVYSCKNAKI
ncbi:hypothetical protein WH96_19330 [Kiloniella spongiae]|uniref:Uncharacterized protein n=1 Tax=Kiloniella spongiae TaxID=1489064 RepID=A0A0H2MR19_9PROT|nr:hypothetical protein [Kiloniella spongiae]KLN59125.1 hypothetical protein WH96_19330 [Kiloniella spongiae]